MKILVVDDEELVRWFLKRALKKIGHMVDTANNGREAFEYIKKGNYDVLMTDLKMPEEDGATLISRVRDLPECPKVVVCSAYITRELSVELKKNGVHTLRKPFTIEELKATLASPTA